ncbi:MAG: DNA-directed RNA polymerase subunit D [Candidatus Woesearchaeota archaeon]
MKLEKLDFDKKSNRLSFVLKDSEESFSNTIRRMIIEEVPTLAVEDVEVKENSSALYDEMLALRLGLCPIKTDLKSYELKDKCKCGGEGCARCELKLVLKGAKKGYIYATEAESMDPKCKFVYAMPVAKLLAKQKIEMQMTAILGKGKEHAKWSPGIAWYFGWPELKTTAKSNLEAFSKHDAVEAKAGNLKIKDINKWNGACEELCEVNGVEVNFSDKDFVFNVESWGQLSGNEMLEKSAEIFLEKLEEFEKLL